MVEVESTGAGWAPLGTRMHALMTLVLFARQPGPLERHDAVDVIREDTIRIV